MLDTGCGLIQITRQPVSKHASLAHPDGWFAACYSHELAAGEVQARTLFDQPVVLFRTESGQAAVLDAHCPHMGAHFGHGGRVEGETIRCPFHGFSFAPEGTCVAIPYRASKHAGMGKIPPTCRARSWSVRERDGYVLVWHHHARAEPTWEVPSIDHRGWLAPLTRMWRLPTHPQETSENSVDLGHFSEVHGYLDLEVLDPLVVDGPCLTTRYAIARRGPGSRVTHARFHVQVHGLGVSFVDVHVPAGDLHVRYWVMCTPIADHECELRTSCSIRRIDRPAEINPLLGLLPRDVASRIVARASYRGFAHDVGQDVAIWSNKRYVDPPALAQGDGPVGRYRKWCRQFYPSLPQLQASSPARAS